MNSEPELRAAISKRNLLSTLMLLLNGLESNSQNAQPVRRLSSSECLDCIVEIFVGVRIDKFRIGREAESRISLRERKIFPDRGHQFFRKSLSAHSVDIVHNWKSRCQIYAILIVINQLRDKKITTDALVALRQQLNIDLYSSENHKTLQYGRIVQKYIERLVKSHPRLHGVTFDSQSGSPVIKTNQAGFLSARESRELAAEIQGYYWIYRRVFVERDTELFVRESLEIDVFDIGFTAYVQSGPVEGLDDPAVFDGVVIFLEYQVWIMVHCADVFTKMRVGLAQTTTNPVVKYSDYAA